MCRFRNVAGPALGLPGDPWLAPPGLLSALPGFLAAPHTGYPSYLTSPRRLPSPPNVGAVTNPVPGNNSNTPCSFAKHNVVNLICTIHSKFLHTYV